MTKQIKVPDEVYERLKKRADDNFRPLGMEIDFMLSYMEISPTVKAWEKQNHPTIQEKVNILPYEKTEKLDNGLTKHTIGVLEGQTEIPRTMSEVLGDIDARKNKLAEDLHYCQDPETRAKLEREAKEEMNVLWEEYHGMKG